MKSPGIRDITRKLALPMLLLVVLFPVGELRARSFYFTQTDMYSAANRAGSLIDFYRQRERKVETLDVYVFFNQWRDIPLYYNGSVLDMNLVRAFASVQYAGGDRDQGYKLGFAGFFYGLSKEFPITTPRETVYVSDAIGTQFADEMYSVQYWRAGLVEAELGLIMNHQLEPVRGILDGSKIGPGSLHQLRLHNRFRFFDILLFQSRLFLNDTETDFTPEAGLASSAQAPDYTGTDGFWERFEAIAPGLDIWRFARLLGMEAGGTQLNFLYNFYNYEASRAGSYTDRRDQYRTLSVNFEARPGQEEDQSFFEFGLETYERGLTGETSYPIREGFAEIRVLTPDSPYGFCLGLSYFSDPGLPAIGSQRQLVGGKLSFILYLVAVEAELEFNYNYSRQLTRVIEFANQPYLGFSLGGGF